MSAITWSKSFQRGGVTGVRMLNSKASGWVGTLTMVSRVPSIVCPEGEEETLYNLLAGKKADCLRQSWQQCQMFVNLDSPCSAYAPSPHLFCMTIHAAIGCSHSQ